MPAQIMTSTAAVGGAVGGVPTLGPGFVVIVNGGEVVVKYVFSPPDAVPMYTRYDAAKGTAVHDATMDPVVPVTIAEASGLGAVSRPIGSRAVTLTKYVFAPIAPPVVEGVSVTVPGDEIESDTVT